MAKVLHDERARHFAAYNNKGEVIGVISAFPDKIKLADDGVKLFA